MRRPLVALVLCCALVAAATGCGARLSDEQMAAATGGGPPRAGVTSGDDTAPAGATTGDAVADPTAGAPAVPTGGPGAPGTDAAGGPGPPPAPGAGGSTAGPTADAGPCRPSGGATDVGVSDTEVRIGNVSTISGPVPGLSQTMINGAKAYVAYANSRGGVCGRRLQLVVGDDRLDTGANRSEHDRLQRQVFAFVGSFSVVDDGGATVLDGTNIPDVSLAISDRRSGIANNFSPNPIKPNAASNGVVKMMQYFKTTYGVLKAGVVYPGQAVAKAKAMSYVNDMEAAGLDVVVKSEVAITQTDYNGVATQMKNAGVELVITALETTGMARLAQAFRQQNYRPKVPFYGAQAYGRKFLQQAGDAADGTIIGVAFAIAEDGPRNPAAATMAQWYARANPGAELDFFSVMGWAATELFVRALAAAGPTPTRAAVLDVLRTYRDVDAGGVLAPHTDPAGKNPSLCFAVLGVQGGKWTRLAPASGFIC
jgi:ABC-type branched-subunit amino acid transport system substrate-binding protein